MAIHHYFWIPAAPGSTRDPHLCGISDPPQGAVTQWGGVMVTFTCEWMEFSSKKHVDFTQKRDWHDWTAWKPWGFTDNKIKFTWQNQQTCGFTQRKCCFNPSGKKWQGSNSSAQLQLDRQTVLISPEFQMWGLNPTENRFDLTKKMLLLTC